MALTITRTRDYNFSLGDRLGTKLTVAFDNSYPTGGESLTPADFGLSEIDFLFCPPKSGYVLEYDYSNKKLLAYVEEALAAGGPLLEVTNATDLSALTGVVLFAIGR